MADSWELKVKAGKYMKTMVVTKEGNRLFLAFGYNKDLLEAVKSMQGSKWHGYDEIRPKKQWSITDSGRNRFQLAYLAHSGKDDPNNPYRMYDLPLINFTPRRNCMMGHQVELTATWLTTHYCIWAAEMATGKTLAAIEGMEYVKPEEAIWVGPRSALYSVQLEFDKWKAELRPRFYTFESFKKLVTDWQDGKPAPQLMVIDEASRVKNPGAQRSEACMHAAEAIRAEWGDDGYLVEMSGSPAPKSPADWWNLCEIARPGFIREGTVEKFRRRLAIIKQENSIAGGSFPRLVCWKDDPRKCNVCGETKDSTIHNPMLMADGGDVHAFVPSVDEISHLYKRLKGLVVVKFKKDCIDLPDKIYKVVQCKPSQSTLNAARVIQAKSPSTIQALTLLRELSDGFQYSEIEFGEETCPRCFGTKIAEEIYDKNDPDNQPEQDELESGFRYAEVAEQRKPIDIGRRDVACPRCDATGVVSSMRREATQVPCPKEDALVDILDEHDDVGRIVIYAGFTGSIERCVQTCVRAGWNFIRVDGRGWYSGTMKGAPKELLRQFMDKGAVEKVAFIAQPSSAGMGLNLTVSPTIVYYSNDFNAESRIQSEDRIHRLGMDHNRGATIVDLFHLPTDAYVLDNLKKKRRLQDLSLGQFKEAIDSITTASIRNF